MPARRASDEAEPRDKSAGGAGAVRTLGRGLEVLRLFAEPGAELNQTDIAAATDLPLPTVYRLVGTLVGYGFLETTSPGRLYRLGPELQRLSAAALGRTAAPQSIHERLRKISAAVGETVNLAILVGGEVIYLDTVTGPRLLTPTTTIGSRISAHCTALGKSLLAQLDDEEIVRRLGPGPYEQLTEQTATDWPRLRARLDQVRAEGISVSDGEYEQGLTSIAVSMSRRPGREPVALNVALPTARATEAVREEIVRELVAAAADLEY